MLISRLLISASTIPLVSASTQPSHPSVPSKTHKRDLEEESSASSSSSSTSSSSSSSKTSSSKSSHNNYPLDKLGKCQGTQREVATCDYDNDGVSEDCPDSTSDSNCLDCEWGQWSDYSDCLCLGLKERHREIAIHNTPSCGKPCVGAKTESVECESDCNTSNKLKRPADCVLGDWEDWGQCSQDCGGGEQVRTREVVSEAINGGKSCNGGLKEVRSCNTQICNKATDCQLGEWSDFSECSKSCDGGEKYRERRILVEASFGGRTCEGNSVLKEVVSCNTETLCMEPIDCVWGSWSDYGPCSKSCNGGQKSRARTIKVAPRNGGKLCSPEAVEELAVCNEQSCEQTIDCKMSEWSEWEDCSRECSGISSRKREILVHPKGNGSKPCDGALKEIKSCNKEFGGDKDVIENQCKIENTTPYPDKSDEILSEWGYWSECSHSCGGGWKSRQRVVEKIPKYQEGNGYKASLEEVVGCNQDVICSTDLPPEANPVDCVWNDWSSWSSCSSTCGSGQKSRTREIYKMPNKDGSPCSHGAKVEVARCDDLPPCQLQECEWAEWSQWSDCLCTGLQERSRQIAKHFHFSSDLSNMEANGDMPGHNLLKEAYKCEGAKSETRSCKPSCFPEPVNCHLSEWSEWGSCSSSCGVGYQTRRKIFEAEVANLGHPCSGDMKESRECDAGVECVTDTPIDCTLSDWSSWGSCSASCGVGQMKRTRIIESYSKNGGKGCGDNVMLEEISGCTDNPTCDTDIDCLWEQWSSWSACSASCGNGYKERDRGIAQAPRGAGKLCASNDRIEVAPCNEQDCKSPCQDVIWSEWSDYSECSASCGEEEEDNKSPYKGHLGGFQASYRKIIRPANYCGKGPGTTEFGEKSVRYRACNRGIACNEDPVDGSWGEWGEWGSCSCGCNGIRERTRRPYQYSSNGGKPVEGASKQIEGCNTITKDHIPDECKGGGDIDCLLSEWGEFGVCTSECGGGVKRRERSILAYPKNLGKSCEGPLVELVGCNNEVCGDSVACKWGEWSEFAACSRNCGGGSQTRFRHIVEMPKKGGQECEKGGALEVRACNEQPCGTLQYCNWGIWSSWSSCSATCGTAEKVRERSLEYSSTPGTGSVDDGGDGTETLITGVLDEIPISGISESILTEVAANLNLSESEQSSNGLFSLIGTFGLGCIAAYGVVGRYIITRRSSSLDSSEIIDNDSAEALTSESAV